MINHKKTISKYFDENYNFWINNQRLSIRKKYLAILNNIKGKDILDVGCGIGIDGELLSERGSVGIGVDLSKNSIEFCKSRKLKGWEFITGDSEEIVFDRKFDIIISSMEIMYHSNLEEAIKNYGKNLGDDGIFLLVTNNPYLISLEYNINYSDELKYEHYFNEHKEKMILKYHRPTQQYLDVLWRNHLHILLYKEIYCTDDDCIKFDTKNKFSMPEFIAMLFRKG